MRSFTHTLVFLLICFAVAPGGLVRSASADLVEITVSSADQADSAQAIFGRAITRYGNRFAVLTDLTALSPEDIDRYRVRTLLAGVALDQLYLISPSRRSLYDKAIDLEHLGRRAELGDGRFIMQMSREAAASVARVLRTEGLRPCRRKVPLRYVAPALSIAPADDFPHDTLAALISQDSLYAFNKRLEDFRTRYVFTDSIDRARDWLVEKFEGFGYADVSIQPFWHSSWAGTGYGYNVIVVKPGYAEPDQVILIGAHYDSYSDSEPWLIAPGADDNASGTALVMEAARVLSEAQLRKTVIFMAFSAEEQWMYGSGYAADQFAAADTKLEVMFNYDMVGYDTDEFYEFYVYSLPYDSYQDLCGGAATRNTSLIPIDPGFPIPGDNYPFEDHGYTIVRVEEAEFNTPNYHRHTDLCSELDFTYMTEITRMATVSLATVADVPYPVEVDLIVDPGDGESLQVAWSDCSSDCSYMVYWGAVSGVYTDSAGVPAGECSYTITGLTDEERCYVLAVGINPEGQRALTAIEGSGVPRRYPRTPGGLTGTVTPNELRLTITWDENIELDLSHYNVYRRIGLIGSYSLLETGVTYTSFMDDDVVAHVGYEYRVTAVDHDGYESSGSDGVLLYPATFDGGPAVVDAFVMDHTYDPDQAEQEAWLDTILGGLGVGICASDEHGGPVTLNDIGQYSTLFWIDDDVIVKNIIQSEIALDAFAQQNTDMLISGYRTIVDWVDKNVPEDHVLYREFGLDRHDYIAYFDFVGAHGQNGWPSVQIDPTRGMKEWRDIPKLFPRPGAEIIATFDSFMDLPDWEGQPVGLAFESSTGRRRVLLSFPLYYLTPASAEALMARVKEYFGLEVGPLAGDLNRSGTIDLIDLVLLLDHLFISQQPLDDPDAADLDSRPGVGIGDAIVLIIYLFVGGPAPTLNGG